MSTADRTHPAGLAAGLGAYAWWGLLPLYFPLLVPAGAVEIVAHRVVWSLGLCLGLLAVTRGWAAFTSALRDPRARRMLALAAALVAVNWLVFVYAVFTEQVVDAALGYFVNPLVTVALAVLVLGERLRGVQWVAVSLGAAAVVVIAVGYGRLPWIALVLAGSFGLYGLVKNRVGRSVPAVAGLAVETLVLAPLAAVYLVMLSLAGTASFGAVGPAHALALAGSGVVTATPLLLFGAAARRLPLSTLGLLQYLAPTMHLVIGVVVLREDMPPARWAGFALVWAALILLTGDGLRHFHTPTLSSRGRDRRRSVRPTPPTPRL